MKETKQYTRKRIRQAIFVLYFCMGICFSSWASRIPDIKNTLGMDDAAWGTILLMIPIGQICGMSISGFMVSKIGSRKIFPIAISGYVISLLFVGFSASEISLIFSLIVFGFFGNFCNIALNTQAITLESKYDKPIMASFHGGWSMAGLFGSVIGLLMSTLKVIPFIHFICVGILIIVAMLINKRYLQQDLVKEVIETEEKPKRRKRPESFLYWLGIVAFCGMAAEGAMSDWSGIYFTKIVGAPIDLAPLALAVYMVMMASGRFLVDKATQLWGAKRVVQTGGLLIFSGLAVAVLFPYMISSLIGFMIIGAGTASIVPTIYSIAGKRSKISTSMALTIVSSVSFLGFLLGPPVIGYVSELTNLRVSYGIIGLLGLLIIFIPSRMSVFRKNT